MSTISLKSYGGKYVSADRSLGGQLFANRDVVYEWEQFEYTSLGSGYYSLKSTNGYYVRCDISRGAKLYADKSSVDTSCRFKITSYSGNKIVLVAAANGRYVTVNSSYELVASKGSASYSDRFTMADASNPIPPSLPTPTLTPNVIINSLDYLIKTVDYNNVLSMFSNGNDMKQVRYHHLNGDIDFYWIKWGSSIVFEWYKYVAADKAIYHKFDVGPPNYKCGRFTFRPGKWLQQYWKMGDYFVDNQTFSYWDNNLFNPNGTIYNQTYQPYPPKCPNQADLYQPHYMVLEEVGNLNFGGNVGKRDYIKVKWVRQDWGLNGLGEHFYFAKGLGWIGWQDRTEGAVPSFWCYNHSASRVIPNLAIVAPSPEFPPGPYLSADNGGAPYYPNYPVGGTNGPFIVPSRAIPYSNGRECFKVINLGKDSATGKVKYAFQTISGWYLSAVNGGGREITSSFCQGPPSTWETFLAYPQTGNYYAFKCIIDQRYYMRYETGMQDSPISARSTTIGNGEKFAFESLGGGKYFIRVYSSSLYGPEYIYAPAPSLLP